MAVRALANFQRRRCGMIVFNGVVALRRKRSFRIEKLASEYFKRANEIVRPFDERIR